MVFKFTLKMFGDKIFYAENHNLIGAMMKVMKEEGVSEDSSELRNKSLEIIEECSYKWLNKN